jgi:DNA-binding Xre family transcriptional regulator
LAALQHCITARNLKNLRFSLIYQTNLLTFTKTMLCFHCRRPLTVKERIMQRVRIDRYKIKKAMVGKFSTFGELAAAAKISTTTMTKATDSYEWRASTLVGIAHALGCSPLDIQTVDEVEEEQSASDNVRARERAGLN